SSRSILFPYHDALPISFPLMTTQGVYQGQRSESDKKRVFILSRSAFAGAQRNAAAVWSGDINSDWVFFKKQIPATTPPPHCAVRSEEHTSELQSQSNVG